MCDTNRVQHLGCVNSTDELKSQLFELVLNSVSSDGGQFALGKLAAGWRIETASSGGGQFALKDWRA